jgi:hypothetical protein
MVWQMSIEFRDHFHVHSTNQSHTYPITIHGDKSTKCEFVGMRQWKFREKSVVPKLTRVQLHSLYTWIHEYYHSK